MDYSFTQLNDGNSFLIQRQRLTSLVSSKSVHAPARKNGRRMRARTRGETRMTPAFGEYPNAGAAFLGRSRP
jgi:hypothetical protein